jgi:hypothetical protein
VAGHRERPRGSISMYLYGLGKSLQNRQ